MSRPPIVHNERLALTYYQVRKAASSSIQHALGTHFIPLAEARRLPGQHFTVVRDPLRRFASLYIGSVAPATSGFYQPWRDMGIYPNMPFDDYIHCICETRNQFRDQHFVIADWPRFVPQLKVYHFDELDKLPIEIPYIGPSYSSQQPTYSSALEELVRTTYAYEYKTYGYDLHQLKRQHLNSDGLS